MVKFLAVFLCVTSSWAQCIKVESKDIQLQFTGYKFTEKVGVSGKFKRVQWAVAPQAKDLPTLLTSASVWIDSHSIDAGQVARNKNLIKGLFRHIPGGRYFRGLITSAAPDGKTATLKLFMGQIETEIPVTVQQTPSQLTLRGTLDLIQAGAKKAFEAMAKLCGPLHRGKDGKRKSWPTVDLEVVAKYSSQCS